MDGAEFREYKDVLSNFLKKLDQNTHQILFLTESFNQVLEDRKILEDFNVIKKRVENITSSLASIRYGELGHDSIAKSTQFDYSKYMENAVFNEFQRQLNRELENIRNRIEDTKRLTDDIFTELKTVVRDKDLKTFEGMSVDFK
jgi:nitrogenase molybdenum-iron protein alpha/beta subunit